jgi:pantoate--beta-alanine ligase
MQVITTSKDMQAFSRQARTRGETIGFVPTMGALHEGHVSLVKRAEKDNDITIVSIFVNPTQFGPGEDFNQYPRDTKGDLNKLSGLGTDIVFLPDEREMYPEGLSSNRDTGDLGSKLCGASRPGHFNGVATVVSILFHCVLPDRAYFGQKDFQQTIIIRKLAGQITLNIDIIMCPTVREPDGLAMSSRNSYLNPEERKASTVLFRALRHAQGFIEKGIHDAVLIKSEIDAVLKLEPLATVEYIEIVDTENLVSMETVKMPAAICLAVRIGKIRLIDNVVVE